MLTIPNGSRDRWSAAWVTALGLAIVSVVGAIDYLTGYELSFSIFYLLPIAFVTWHASRAVGLFLCGISTVVWLVLDITSGHPYSHWIFPVWNAGVRLGFFLMTTFLLAELKTRLSREESLARTDGLTGVLNARAFKDVSQRLLDLAARHGHPVALGYIDLDDFKTVNDRGGHSSGDRLLQVVGSRLGRSVRASDVVGRLGGDEFAIFLPETGGDGAKRVFAKIHEELMKGAAEGGWPIGFSVGVALFSRVASTLTVDEALKVADGLMYRGKETGKNRLIYAEPAGVGYDAELPVATGDP